MSPVSQICFALNAHGPRFERYALLCTASIRHWCGDRVKIRVFQPDNLPPCSPAALAFFARHHVEVINFYNPWLPRRLDDPRKVPARHLTYNKLFTLLDVEPDEQRVFLDADQVLLGDPIPVLSNQPACTKLVAADTPESFIGDWDQLYRDVGIPPTDRRITMWSTYSFGHDPEPPQIVTHPYFCSGLVSVTATSRLPRLWLHYTEVLEHQINKLLLTYFVDQISLPLAVQASGQAWDLLPVQCSTTPHVFRWIDNPLFFHYWDLDALAAQAARTSLLHAHLSQITSQLRREVGLDMRFQLLTQLPRWRRRLLGIARQKLASLGLSNTNMLRT